MLCELRIRNLAIVEELLFAPQAGLNVLSGETGAGKSILVEAIELLLGGKAAADLIRTGADSLRVDGVFQFESDDFFRRRGLDLALEEGTLVISRELGRNGRSRITLNDEPATLARLRAVGERLADLHGQHEHQALLRPETHIDVLDRYGLSLRGGAPAAGALNPIEQYRLERGQWIEVRRKLDELETRQGNIDERRARLEQATAEIRAAGLKPDEESALRAERQIIQHAARLADGVGAVVDDLSEGDAPIVTRLGHAARQLAQAAQIDPSLAEAAAALEEARVTLGEHARQLAGYREGLQFDPDRAEWIENRLTVIGRLKKKHGGSEADIVARGAALAAELAGLADEGVLIERLRAEAARAARRMLQRGGELTAWRRDAAERLLKAAGLELSSLGMAKAQLTARFAPPPGAPAGADPAALDDAAAAAAGERGLDQVEFFLAANPGEEARPLARVASGGELSRVMLAMKTVLRGVDPMPILLFDEVDAGIGGAVASAVGERLAELAVGRQLLVITHLPMVASQADHHFRVQKSVKKGRTVTEVRHLDPAERAEELARMLAGAQAGTEAREAARALLEAGRRGARPEKATEPRRGGE